MPMDPKTLINQFSWKCSQSAVFSHLHKIHFADIWLVSTYTVTYVKTMTLHCLIVAMDSNQPHCGVQKMLKTWPCLQPYPWHQKSTQFTQGRSQGGAQGARAPPLSCRAMTSYERCLATHVFTLASCKLKFTVLELVVPTIYRAAHINQQHGFTLAPFRAREGRTLREDQHFKGYLLVGVTSYA